MNTELLNFIRESLNKGLSKEEIHKALLLAGWKEQEVREGLSLFADVNFPLAVPRPKPYLPAREAFLYLLSFVTLYIAAVNFGLLLFNFIDRVFPNQLIGQSYYDSSRLSFPLAAVIIAFPLYLYIVRYLKLGEGLDPEQQESKVKKWLSYINLVIVAVIIIVDLVMVLTNLLGGELTIKFILQATSILYIAGSIFWYYLWDLQRLEKKI